MWPFYRGKLTGGPAWKRLVIYAAIGGIGFCVEGLIISFATIILDFSAITTRLISFPSAVFITWWLNRKYNFRSDEAVLTEASRYFGSQGVGALTNVAVFVCCLYFLPSLAGRPIFALGLGAIAGLTVNFLLSYFYVFNKSRKGN
jgi:putative flippase GtrA